MQLQSSRTPDQQDSVWVVHQTNSIDLPFTQPAAQTDCYIVIGSRQAG